MRVISDRRLRWLALLYGAAALLWLSREDNDVAMVTVLGVGLALLLLSRAVLGRMDGGQISSRDRVAGAVVLGALAGLGSAVATIGLMLFKNALHAHLFLDYPPLVMLGILQRAPAWTLAGVLAGLGLALAWLGLRQTADRSS